MTRQDGPETPLHLLLEDYEKRPRQWLNRAVSGRKPRIKRTSASPADVDDRPIHLLLEDYASRETDWWAAFDSRKSRSKQVYFPDAELPPPRILLEDYDPASRALDRVRPAARRARPEAGAERAGHPAMAAKGPSYEGEPRLNLLLDWDGQFGAARSRQAGAISLAVHAALILFLLLQPYVTFTPPPLEDALEQQEVTLLAPPDAWLRELTQTAPNEGPVTQELQGPSEVAVPVFAPPEQAEQAPPEPKSLPEITPPEPPQPEPSPEPPLAAQQDPLPPQESPPPTPAAQSPQPDALSPGTEFARRRRPNELPMPKRPSAAEPNIELETPKATMPGRTGPVQLGSLTLNAPPGQMIEGAIEELAKQGGGRQAVGDDFGTGGLGGYMPPSPGNAGSNLELLSDPKGVDFRPYLIQVLASVRRNWYAVIPESARLGFTRGRTMIQFAIVRNGSVSKLVIASSSGVQPLDRAAVAGISASNPFPPLPPEYPGGDIRLQFSFLYNMKNR